MANILAAEPVWDENLHQWIVPNQASAAGIPSSIPAAPPASSSVYEVPPSSGSPMGLGNIRQQVAATTFNDANQPRTFSPPVSPKLDNSAGTTPPSELEPFVDAMPSSGISATAPLAQGGFDTTKPAFNSLGYAQSQAKKTGQELSGIEARVAAEQENLNDTALTLGIDAERRNSQIAKDLEQKVSENRAIMGMATERATQAQTQIDTLHADLARDAAAGGKALQEFAVSGRTRAFWGSILARAGGMIGQAVAGRGVGDPNAGVANQIVMEMEKAIEMETNTLNTSLKAKQNKIAGLGKAVETYRNITKDQQSAIKLAQSTASEAAALFLKQQAPLLKNLEARQAALTASAQLSQNSVAKKQESAKMVLQAAKDEANIANEKAKLSQAKTAKTAPVSALIESGRYKTIPGKEPRFGSEKQTEDFAKRGDVALNLMDGMEKLSQGIPDWLTYKQMSQDARQQLASEYAGVLSEMRTYLGTGANWSENEEAIMKGQIPSPDAWWKTTQRLLGAQFIDRVGKKHATEAARHLVVLGDDFQGYMARAKQNKAK
jgi:hypothetical protein